MEKGDKFTEQNKNTKQYYWFTHFKAYLCISGGYSYYLQWWTIFRQCQEQTLIQEVKNPMGREKCSKKPFTVPTLQQKGRERAAQEAYGSWIAHVWPPRNHHTVLISAIYCNKSLFYSLWTWDIWKICRSIRVKLHITYPHAAVLDYQTLLDHGNPTRC